MVVGRKFKINERVWKNPQEVLDVVVIIFYFISLQLGEEKKKKKVGRAASQQVMRLKCTTAQQLFSHNNFPITRAKTPWPQFKNPHSSSIRAQMFPCIDTTRNLYSRGRKNPMLKVSGNVFKSQRFLYSIKSIGGHACGVGMYNFLSPGNNSRAGK